MKSTAQTETCNGSDCASATEYLVPEVNITETKDAYVLEAELPGVNKDGVELTIDDNELTIIGRRTADVVNGEVLLRERVGADFRRVFEIDTTIDASRISAKIEDGVLRLTLPKSEQVKPRQIAVAG